MRKILAVLTVLYIIATILGIVILVLHTPVAEVFRKEKRADVFVIRLEGPIRYSCGFFPGADEILKELRYVKKRRDIEGVLIRINSPGGSLAAAEAIHNHIRELRKEKKVVALLEDIGLSGGYYVASACDKIIAHEGSLVGSIGVIGEVANVEELFRKIGVRFEILKAGRYKDIGSPFRGLTEEERAMLNNLLTQAHQQFINAVAGGRDLPRDVVETFAEGRIYLGKEAKELRMIDKIGDKLTAERVLKELLNVEEIEFIEHRPRRGLLTHLLGAISSGVKDLLIDNRINLEYISQW